MIDVCLLGCGGSMPMVNRFLSSTIINYKGRKILIDCGEGTQVAMTSVGAGFKSLDVICITHCHGDHIIGLPGLLSTVGNSGRIEPLIIIGPKGIKEVVTALRTIAKYLPYEIIIIEDKEKVALSYTRDSLRLNDDNNCLIIDILELDHSTDCIGYKFYFKRERKFSLEKAIKNNVPKVLWSKLQKCDNNTIIYDEKEYKKDLVLGDERRGIKICLITDTRPVDTIVEFIRDSDLFICEGTYGDDKDTSKAIKNKHMTFREAASLAQRGLCDKLLLTHFSPALTEPAIYEDNAKDIFENTIIGYDGLKLVLKYKE